ncbi:MAG TPA: GAF domain-containing protein [Bradyrhizobium sp.]|uniref:GAF domain-containing protein n=1 Tax=Bradyrhizobium sp. TaxID=376 RepID=UPI002CABBDA9|nr:GAF domain-containing protein [Bradyrhizobium sp.]HLZ02525.1 GAF domain-containing protein [Bradyrhizobium sp.]
MRTLTRELKEAREQETATAEVLQVINSSPGDLAPVFQAMLGKATRLCGAGFGALWTYDGERFSIAATYAVPAALAEFVREPVPVAASASLVEIVRGQNLVHIADLATTELYRASNRVRRAYVDLGGARTLVNVALRKDNTLLGVFNIYRQEVRPFSDKEIALVQNFAAQAVIAIENARLLGELRQRTIDLTESLQHQTATSDVLKVISRSTFDLKPVLETVARTAARLCEAEMGFVSRRDGDVFRYVAAVGLTPEASAGAVRLQKYLDTHPVSGRSGRRTMTGRVVSERRALQIADITADAEYQFPEIFELSGARALLGVPLLRDGEPIGMMSLGRQRPEPFTERQIELVRTFADQAVIAIENRRLLTEQREALERQTATAEVLQVINSSPGNLAPVFDAILVKAHRLCGVAYGSLQVYDGERFSAVAVHNLPQQFADLLRRGFRGSDHPVGRVLLAGDRLVHISDCAEIDHPVMRSAVDLAGIRTALFVPLRRDETLLGLIVSARREVRPFSENEIALLEGFAAQAVIAIENARLLGELRERQAELRTTFDNMGDGVAMFDAAARLAAWNRNLQEMLDLPDAYLAERPGFAELFRYLVARGEFGSADLEAQLRSSLDDTRREMRYERTRPDGRVVEVRRNPVPDGGFVLIYADITERKRAEQAIRAARDAAETALRELQTAQDRLVQTQKLASLGQLTAGIAHEIKNPLNFVNNFSSLSVELIDELQKALVRVQVDDETSTEIAELADVLRDNLGRIVQHGKRADSIVKNMLLHAREGSGDHRPVDINALVEESLNLAYHGARAEKQGFNITLGRSFDPAVGQADVFPQEITRVLLNLISNGFDAVVRRSREVDRDDFEPMLAAATRNLGDCVEITIRDNGIGIPPDVKEKMFNPFFTTKPAGEGTGLGLSISHDIVVKQHAGSIEVDTCPGEFTEIRIVLPRVSASLT